MKVPKKFGRQRPGLHIPSKAKRKKPSNPIKEALSRKPGRKGLQMTVGALKALAKMTVSGTPSGRTDSSNPPTKLTFIYVLAGTAFASNGVLMTYVKLTDDDATGVIPASLVKKIPANLGKFFPLTVFFHPNDYNSKTTIRSDTEEWEESYNLADAAPPNFASVVPDPARKEPFKVRMGTKLFKAIAQAAELMGAESIQMHFEDVPAKKGTKTSDAVIRVTARDGKGNEMEHCEWLLMPMRD